MTNSSLTGRLSPPSPFVNFSRAAINYRVSFYEIIQFNCSRPAAIDKRLVRSEDKRNERSETMTGKRMKTLRIENIYKKNKYICIIYEEMNTFDDLRFHIMCPKISVT